MSSNNHSIFVKCVGIGNTSIIVIQFNLRCLQQFASNISLNMFIRITLSTWSNGVELLRMLNNTSFENQQVDCSNHVVSNFCLSFHLLSIILFITKCFQMHNLTTRWLKTQSVVAFYNVIKRKQYLLNMFTVCHLFYIHNSEKPSELIMYINNRILKLDYIFLVFMDHGL